MAVENLEEGNEKVKDEMNRVILIAVIVSIVVGLIITLYFVFGVKETFSALYIRPDSYSNYVVNNTVSFIYGVRCFEGKNTRYIVDIFLGNISVGRNTFEMGSGQREWAVSVNVPEYVRFPVKVRVELRSPTDTYDTYFWLRGRK